jgi:hypothetical protein
MPRDSTPKLAPSEDILLGLLFIQKYRFLTVKQFAAVTELKPKSASEALLRLERQKWLSHFGNVGIRGYGKTPKVYYLTKRGYDVLVSEGGFPEELIGGFKNAKVNTRWSPQMYHRMATLDTLIALEVGIRRYPHMEVTETFIEHRQERLGRTWQSETTDYVAAEVLPQNRIVPDAGFILENIETGRRALFLVEVDMGTERITTKLAHAQRFSVHHKMAQYDRYLQSLRFQQKYEAWGEFKFFTLLFITTTAERRDNLRAAMSNLPAEMHAYYRFNTLDVVHEDFFNGEWRARAIDDENRYQLIRGQT